MSWYQIIIEIPLEKPNPARLLPTPVQKLIKEAEIVWSDAGSPSDLALFMGEYIDLSRQRFFLPPTANEHCPIFLEDLRAQPITEPEPYRLLQRVAGSESAFTIWFPWVHLDSIEYPPVRSGTFRLVSNDDEVSNDPVEDDPDRSDPTNDYDDLVEPDVDAAIAFMRSGKFVEALPILLRAIRSNPSSFANWYMAGQCYRFSENFPKAIRFLKEAARRNPMDEKVFLGLGIAFQLHGQFHNAVGTFVKALEIDPNYDLAYNSLALTQMKMGDYEFALHNYDRALKAMTRRLVTTFQNSPGRGITKHHDSPYLLWTEYAMFGAMFISSADDSIQEVAWPTGEFAMREEKDERFEGLFWNDQIGKDGKKTRIFLPNYFNIFETRLRDNADYALFLRGKGTALDALGHETEAQLHYDEAEYFLPTRNS